MDFIKRAFLYLRRKIGRSLLLTLVITAIMTFVLAGLIIQNAAISAVNNTKNSVGTTVTLSANRQKLFQQNRKSSSSTSGGFTSINQTIISQKTAEKLANLSNVSAYQMTSTADVTASSFTVVKSSSSTSGQGGFPGRTQSSQSGNTSISGVSTTAADSNFKDKNYVIKKGRGIKTSDKNTNNVIVEKTLAANNSIKVGSTISVKNSDSKIVKLNVVGIYQAKASTSGSDPMAADPSNTIYASYTLASSLSGNSGNVSGVTYTLTNSSKEKAFVKSAKKIISSKLQLTTSDQTYELLSSSVKSIESIASKIVWIVAIAGIAILTLVLILMIRERKHEIGILMSLGEAKSKIVGQIFVETVSVLIVSLCFAGIFGNFFGNVIGKQLVSQESTSSQTLSGGGSAGGMPGNSNANNAAGNNQTNNNRSNRSTGGFNNFRSNLTGSSSLNKLSTHLTVGTLLKLGAFGLVIVGIATLLGSIPILSLKPKRILISE
ncbi:FtsX-like permease family protein [Oenococcus sicerae]|mgnify:CR=1 FL=1|uniref:FtsX-like permease family protein n=1 Tax=Oenococcus sicerae TaxID=2203724 RepID=A0AAJ1VMA0_9LACO|nr:ABC transporter permease [Oenococcus sicerae]MDN6900338.1 FtsX-like permease family protein [Oenococcus sicerae]QAS69913.1 FtsX-like permease family protein [Oenococcus sicerae]